MLPSSPVHSSPKKTTAAVTGTAVAQYAHWPSSVSRMSLVLMPKMLATELSGRNITVTMVNA